MHGLVFASAIWCAVFAKLVRRAGLQGNVIFLIDDIFIVAKSKKEYISALEKVFLPLQKVNFKIKFGKYLFNIKYNN